MVLFVAVDVIVVGDEVIVVAAVVVIHLWSLLM